MFVAFVSNLLDDPKTKIRLKSLKRISEQTTSGVNRQRVYNVHNYTILFIDSVLDFTVKSGAKLTKRGSSV